MRMTMDAPQRIDRGDGGETVLDLPAVRAVKKPSWRSPRSTPEPRYGVSRGRSKSAVPMIACAMNAQVAGEATARAACTCVLDPMQFRESHA